METRSESRSSAIAAETALQRFRAALARPNLIESLRLGLIGEGGTVPGPFGGHPLVYADYVASGRALRQVEDFVLDEVLPYYANSHTEASFCGAYTTRMREEARAQIARLMNVDADVAVIFTGSGATAGLNRLVWLLGVREAVQRREKPIVFVGPYEHHSNLLPWRESGATVVELEESADGGPDIEALEAALQSAGSHSLKIGAFSAASNVTGRVTDTRQVTAVLKRHGALSVWDYAGGGPYLPMDMNPEAGLEKDAIALSPHKFVGGPGASGLLLVRKSAVATSRPTWPGGGTVSFVSSWAHDYVDDLAAREEGGTPNVIGDIRAALAFLIKEAVGQDFIYRRNRQLVRRALSVWGANPNMTILGSYSETSLPIFSFRVRAKDGGYLHHQLFTRMLSDVHGVQARGGCACAGPYSHRLLGIDRSSSSLLRSRILSGDESEKPGFVRVNLSYLIDDDKADKIITAVDGLARNPFPFVEAYSYVEESGQYEPVGHATVGVNIS